MARAGLMDEADGGDGSGGGGGGGGSGGGGSGGDGGGDPAGGNPGPTDAEAKLLREVMDKKTKLRETTEKLDQATVTIRKLEELGGLDAIAAIVAEHKQAENKKLEDKGEWDRLRTQMAEEHGREINAIKEGQSALAAENDSLKSMVAELTVGNAFAASSFIKEDLTMPTSKVRVLYGPHFEFKDGAVVAFDKPVGAADRTPLVDASGNPMGFEVALKKIIDSDPDREQLLKSKLKPGSGSATNPKGAPSKTLEEPRGISRIAAALSKGGLKK